MLTKIRRQCKGFTLIEIVIVMVILGILAVVAIPRFIDLADNASISATQGSLAAVRSVLAVRYAQIAATTGNAAFPAALVATDFANSELPTNTLTGVQGVAVVAAAPAGLHGDDPGAVVRDLGVAPARPGKLF